MNIGAQLKTFPYGTISKLLLSSNSLMAMSRSKLCHSKASRTNKQAKYTKLFALRQCAKS